MLGLDKRRLVLLQVRFSGPHGEIQYSTGTGYFITDKAVLTASHVIPSSGVTQIELRLEASGQWLLAEVEPLWRDEQLDAAVIAAVEGISGVPAVEWVEQPITENTAWTSSGYPKAAVVTEDGRSSRKTVGLSGTLYHQGGAGQGARELDLTVDSPPTVDHWPGISGAPVFAQGRLAGLIRDAPESFKGGRLIGVPASSLLQAPGFRLAIAPPWLNRLPTEPWVLVVLSEQRKSDLGALVSGSLRRADADKSFRASIGAQQQLPVVEVAITEALKSPERWLSFVSALCKAPVAIFDATNHQQRSANGKKGQQSGIEPEPGIMLALGVRAVVRRGVTLTSTADEISEKNLSQLPFNVQESKLIHHGRGFEPKHPYHPLNRIAKAIEDGWQELLSQPRYLDLPAYDAVRGPVPTALPPGNNALERVLVLCPFRDFDKNWLHITNTVVSQYPTHSIARMLDIDSPRLVGQALYESIRWAKTCVVDWTRWRANVFFELGVRTACTDMPPICLIESAAKAQAARPKALKQMQQLLKLFEPTSYNLQSQDAIVGALSSHELANGHNSAVPSLTALPHGAVHKVCQESFDWLQEHLTLEPHEHLRQSVEAPFGKDRQISGHSPILFSANASFRKELEYSVKERWIAAWYYLRHRHPREQWCADAKLRGVLRKLGNDVLQYGVPDPRTDHLQALRSDIYDVIDELDDLDAGLDAGNEKGS